MPELPIFEVLPYVSHDPRFLRLVIGHAKLEKLGSGYRWAEGPAYFPAGRYLVFSDIPNDRMLRFDETDSSVSVFRSPSFNSNGNTTDRQGRLVSCEHFMRRITRTEHDGSITVLADKYDGRRFNSPNDVVVKSDNSIWFSDPTYGIDGPYEGQLAKSEIGASNIYRIDGSSGEVSLVVSDRVRPNGLAFSPDESILYVADTGGTHVDGLPFTLWAYKIRATASARARCSRPVLTDCSMDSAAMFTAISGHRPGVACFALRRTERISARSRSVKSSAMSASAVCTATGSISVGRPRSTRSSSTRELPSERAVCLQQGGADQPSHSDLARTWRRHPASVSI